MKKKINTYPTVTILLLFVMYEYLVFYSENEYFIIYNPFIKIIQNNFKPTEENTVQRTGMIQIKE